MKKWGNGIGGARETGLGLIFFERNSQDLMGQVFSGPRICFVLGDKI
jgi:hypothetical protein